MRMRLTQCEQVIPNASWIPLTGSCSSIGIVSILEERWIHLEGRRVSPRLHSKQVICLEEFALSHCSTCHIMCSFRIFTSHEPLAPSLLPQRTSVWLVHLASYLLFGQSVGRLHISLLSLYTPWPSILWVLVCSWDTYRQTMQELKNKPIAK